MKSYLVVLSVLVACANAGIRYDPSASWRVIGGTNAPDGLYPHQISLQVNGRHNCGGSIVGSEWVITACHCVRGYQPSALSVVAGSNKISTGGHRYQVREIHAHEKYNPNTGLNDVAILRVGPIAFSDKVGPIAAEKGDIQGDVDVILSGWGSTITGGSTPDNLQHVNLKTTTVEQCRSAHSGRPVEATQVCTLTKAGEGACHGDSGGPLMINANGRLTVLGIVSWGQPCARGYPDVFARVPSYVDWFNSKCNCL